MFSQRELFSYFSIKLKIFMEISFSLNSRFSVLKIQFVTICDFNDENFICMKNLMQSSNQSVIFAQIHGILRVYFYTHANIIILLSKINWNIKRLQKVLLFVDQFTWIIANQFFFFSFWAYNNSAWNHFVKKTSKR